eukprot:jgi/Tetstr1/444586/TSEL_032436.t1
MAGGNAAAHVQRRAVFAALLLVLTLACSQPVASDAADTVVLFDGSTFNAELAEDEQQSFAFQLPSMSVSQPPSADAYVRITTLDIRDQYGAVGLRCAGIRTRLDTSEPYWTADAPTQQTFLHISRHDAAFRAEGAVQAIDSRRAGAPVVCRAVSLA